jgi:hypothetical protein
MPTDPEWITAAIEKACKLSAPVPDVVWSHVAALLKGKFSQRGIPPVELANIARELIEEMVPTPSTPERTK